MNALRCPFRRFGRPGVVLLHRLRAEPHACVRTLVRLLGMCVGISENVTAYQCAMCVSTDMWEQCECVRWRSPSTVKAAASNHIRECVGDRMTRPGTSQRLPEATHRHTHTHTYTRTYTSTYWHILSLTRSISPPNTHTHTCTQTHLTPTVIRPQVLTSGHRLGQGCNRGRCLCLHTHRRALTERRGK